MNDSFFGFQKSFLTKDQNKKLLNPILSDEQEYDFVVISDKYLTAQEVAKLHKYVEKVCEIGYAKMKVLYPFDFIPSEKELKKQMSHFYSDFSIDLTKYINPGSKIITLGRSLNAITFNTDVDVEAFYDIIFNKSYFYAPKLKSYVFPIDGWSSFWEKDNWNNYFAKYQFKKCNEFQVSLQRQPKLNLIVVEDEDKFLQENMEAKEIGIDTETSGLNFMRHKIGCCTISFDGVTGYYLDWDKVNKPLFNEFIKNKFTTGSNLKFDYKFFRKAGVPNFHIDFDTLNAGHLLNEMRSNSQKTLAWLYTNYGGYEHKLIQYKRRYKNCNYTEIPKDILSEYAIMDAIVNFQEYQQLKEQFNEIDKKVFNINDKWNLSKYYYEIVISSINLFSEIEYDGAYIDWTKLTEVGKEFTKRINNLQEKLASSFGMTINEINWNSDIQLGEVLKKNGWPCNGLSKNGDFLVNDETLNLWSKTGYEQANIIIDIHKLSVLMNTFIGLEKENSGYWQYKESDDKVHANFAVMLADSGRNKCGNPNLQNVPKHGDDALLIRSYYSVPSNEYGILSLDFSGFQLRIGAALSQDKEMKKAFTEFNGDLHALTSISIFSSSLPKKILVTLENNNILEIFEDQWIKIERNNKEIEILAKELIETDYIL